MKLAIALLLVLVASVGRADVVVDLAAGAGNDSSALAGFAMGHASVAAELSEPAPPPRDRALAADPEGKGAMWIFTGIDRDDKNGIGITADAIGHARPDGGRAIATASGWMRGYGWELDGHVAIEPVGGFRERFWRSGRGDDEARTSIEIPPMWAIGLTGFVIAACNERIEIGGRARTGLDDELDFTGARVLTRHTSVDIFTFRLFELGVARQTIGPTTYGTSVSGLDFDLAGVTVKTDLEVTARGGVAIRSPVGPYEQTGSSTNFSGPAGDAFSYWLEVHRRGMSVGGGSWIRLDPTGHAVDAGHLATLSLDQQVGDLKLHGELEAGRVRRIATGLYAPAGIPPVGARMWLARGTLSGQYPLTDRIGLAASAWVERSDRDDPRWTVPATGELATHAGADVTASWRFQWIPRS